MKAKSKKEIGKYNSPSITVVPREQWEKNFKLAIKVGHLPDKAKGKNISNQFDKGGWTW